MTIPNTPTSKMVHPSPTTSEVTIHSVIHVTTTKSGIRINFLLRINRIC